MPDQLELEGRGQTQMPSPIQIPEHVQNLFMHVFNPYTSITRALEVLMPRCNKH